jgi:ABC-type Mn2+/Zn2+ transport system permease subunit
LLINWALRWAAARDPGYSVAPGWESLLFGSIATVNARDAGIAWGVGAAILGLSWYFRRPLVFWAFDESAAPAFGIPAQGMKYLLVVLLTLAIVTAMKLAGVVLASALLVLPGVTALRLSDRLAPVSVLSVATGLVGVLGGLALAFTFDRVPPGACIVSVLIALFIGARVAARVQSGRSVS